MLCCWLTWSNSKQFVVCNGACYRCPDPLGQLRTSDLTIKSLLPLYRSLGPLWATDGSAPARERKIKDAQ